MSEMDATSPSLSIANHLLARTMALMRFTSWFDAGACAAIMSRFSLPRRRSSAGRVMVMHFSGSVWSGMPSDWLSGLPPLKWSDLKYGFDHGGEGEWLGNGIVLKG